MLRFFLIQIHQYFVRMKKGGSFVHKLKKNTSMMTTLAKMTKLNQVLGKLAQQPTCSSNENFDKRIIEQSVSCACLLLNSHCLHRKQEAVFYDVMR